MQPSRAPWWFYIVAVSFLASFPLLLYNAVWGPADDGITSFAPVGGYLTAKEVQPEKPAGRAGVRAGDRILVVNGLRIRGFLDYWLASVNFESGRPIAIKIEREGKPVELTMTLGSGSLGQIPLSGWEAVITTMFTFGLALLIGVRRPQEPAARVASWLMATIALNNLLVASSWASFWRNLPWGFGLLLWPAEISSNVLGAIAITFAIVFPRVLTRNRLLWALIWLPSVILASLQTRIYLEMVYQPRQTPSILSFVDVPVVHSWLSLCYALAILVVWTIQYRRLKDANERRRMLVLFAGGSLTALAASATSVLLHFGTLSAGNPILIISNALYATWPLALTYAVLRHRVLDLGLIVRRGLQYALARGALVSAVPILAAIFIADLLLHGNQPILAVFRARGWIYVALAALAAVALMKRRDWLEALDRRFFREQYDARRILCDVVEEVRVARSFEQEAPQVTARIETALHPEFVALLVSEPQEKFYRTLAASPAGTGPPQLQRESKFVALVRLLGKPVEVSHTGANWLQQQLPHEETDYLRRGRIDLVVPVATDPERKEVLLVLGVKRSEEPYSGEDRDLLVAIAASLAILLERPATAPSLPPKDRFEECPQCGSCYDSGSSQCAKEGARLIPVTLPRLLDGRYHLERRLGRGGMGTVYAASDASLERLVAVKVIREDLVGSAEAAERFRREARAAASFAHPNVVTVYDFGVAMGTRAFLVMEMLEGKTLREKLRIQKHLPIEDLLSISRHICAALAAAHQRHLVHRDLKPENIFLVAPESSETAKILDFGIAKFVHNYADSRTAETASGAILGTPRYMPPEQRGGQSVHHSWDLWALAVMTYEMLTGFYPFEDGAYDWLAPGPSVPFTPVDRYLPTAPKTWQLLFERSFARELSCRHESVESFLSELQLASG